MNYIWDNSYCIYRRENAKAFSYTDGDDVEKRIFDIIHQAGDKSTFSPELAKAITDWPSEYHLSVARHCLIRPLGIKQGDKVLEVGCGCGAITRYLGEIGAEVVAVEGSLQRARIASERCRDLPNVKVFVDDLLHFQIKQRFDWVLLIGVLEYAPVFSNHQDPVGHYLRAATKFIAPHGKIAIAIENKLGLKYFNGCCEDHVNIPFFGVQGLYGPKMPITFGRRELVAHVKAAGLSHTHFYYPFPDYKLPTTILADEAFPDPLFNPVELLTKCHARDWTGWNNRAFDDALVFSELYKNDLLPEFSNSFLIIAGYVPISRRDPTELSFTFSAYRVPEFSTQTKIVRDGETIRVIKKPLQSGVSRKRVLPDGAILENITGESDYVPGRMLLWHLIAARAREGTLEQVITALCPWFEFLLQHAHIPPHLSEETGDKQKKLTSFFIDGKYLDCTPFNLIETENGLVHIDIEWTTDREIPLGWVVTRSVTHSLKTGVPKRNMLHTITEVITHLCAEYKLSVSDTDVEEWCDIEKGLINIVSLVPSGKIPLTQTSSGLESFEQKLFEKGVHITLLEQAIAERDGHIISLEQAIAERDGHIISLDQAIAEREARVAALLNSVSWRLTAPFRWLFRGKWLKN